MTTSRREFVQRYFHRDIDDPHLYEFDYGVPSDRPYVAMPGHYTRYGEVTPLLTELDDRFVIFAIGDQVQLLFTDPGPAPAGALRSTSR